MWEEYGKIKTEEERKKFQVRKLMKNERKTWWKEKINWGWKKDIKNLVAGWILRDAYLPTPPLRQDMTQGQFFFKQSLTGLNSEFSFSKTSCLSKAEEPSLPYYLPIAGGRIIGFIPFPRVLVLYEMQSVLSRIWTRITMSISYDDNHYTTGYQEMSKNR